MADTSTNRAAAEWSRLIRRRRKALDLNQVELAEKIGTSQQVVSAWEQRRYPPNAVYQGRLVKHLGIDPIELHALMTRLGEATDQEVA